MPRKAWRVGLFPDFWRNDPSRLEYNHMDYDEEELASQLEQHRVDLSDRGFTNMSLLSHHILSLGGCNRIDKHRSKEDRAVQLALGWVIEDAMIESFPRQLRLFNPAGRAKIGESDTVPDLVSNNGITIDVKAYPMTRNLIRLKPSTAKVYALYLYRSREIQLVDVNYIKTTYREVRDSEWHKQVHPVPLDDLPKLPCNKIPMTSSLCVMTISELQARNDEKLREESSKFDKKMQELEKRIHKIECDTPPSMW